MNIKRFEKRVLEIILISSGFYTISRTNQTKKLEIFKEQKR